MRGSGSPDVAVVHGLAHPAQKRDRQRAIREVVAREMIGSQQELADRLTARGYAVTQATVSRDIAELGLVKAWRGDRHVYVLADDLPPSTSHPDADEKLSRMLADIPIAVGRSGLILVLTGTPGAASVIAQAIDESTLDEQVGTVAGDNTLLVLFADEAALLRWLARFNALQSPSAGGVAGTLGTGGTVVADLEEIR
ncbi:MAG: transcriptional repressor [Chloroflexi bacterium]|nr:transcriptional repressor [Chloroflexota bacterium]